MNRFPVIHYDGEIYIKEKNIPKRLLRPDLKAVDGKILLGEYSIEAKYFDDVLVEVRQNPESRDPREKLIHIDYLHQDTLDALNELKHNKGSLFENA